MEFGTVGVGTELLQELEERLITLGLQPLRPLGALLFAIFRSVFFAHAATRTSSERKVKCRTRATNPCRTVSHEVALFSF